MAVQECYKAIVNESETITAAKPACWKRFVRGVRGSGTPNIERS